MCRVSYRILSIGGGGKLQSSVLTWLGYIAHNNYEGSEGMLSRYLKKNRCSEIDSEGTCSQF